MLRLCGPILLLALWPPDAASAASERAALLRADGSELVYYVDRDPARGRQPLLIMLQGSGCDSVVGNALVPWMAARLAPRHAVLTIEKYGVATGADGNRCTADFRRGNSLTRRALDTALVIAALRRQHWWNGELVIFGGSEGGAIAALAAPLIPETRAVIIWSSGIGLPVGEMIRAVLPPPVQAEADRIFAEARAHPGADREWGGASYAWWADALDQMPARSLLQTPAPTLLIHGTSDQFAPVASARAARDLIEASGRTGFTYREYPGYDHFMVDAAGVDHRAAVVAEANAWLRARNR
ncbi:MAG TPA: hypothetical protein VMG08_01250 [Allosphingosinicella sp.]|nr:hypothetical protein [Allosphingosinicella sp.]